VKHTLKRSLAGSLAITMASCCVPARPQARSDQIHADQTALALEQQGKTTDAEEAWRAVSKARPADAVPFAHLGLLEARQEHYPQAIAYYRKAMALNPAMPGLRLNMGLALFKDGQYKQAIEAFTPLLKAQDLSSPEAQRLTVLIGMSYYGLGQYPAAIPYLKQASDRDAQNLPLLLTLAHSCLLSKQYQCVLDAYHQMVTLNADSAEADMLVGEALDEMKDSVGATREFRAAIATNPKEPNAHFGLGYLLWTQKQYQEAAHEFQAELNNTPNYIQAMAYLADADIQINKMKEAETLLEKLAKDNPTLFMARLDLGIVYAEAGRNEEALRQLKAAEALKPTDVNVHWRLGRLYRSTGKAAAAKYEFNKAQSLNKAADAALLEVMTSAPQKSKASSAGLDPK
jgi:tetratricopeptide (TPR) repeat protein